MTGTHQALKKCSLKAGMLNVRGAREKGKKKSEERKARKERRRKKKEINIL